MKSVVLEKHEFENRKEFISQTILPFVVHQVFNAEKALIYFRPKFFKKYKQFDCDHVGRSQAWRKMTLNIETNKSIWAFLDYQGSIETNKSISLNRRIDIKLILQKKLKQEVEPTVNEKCEFDFWKNVKNNSNLSEVSNFQKSDARKEQNQSICEGKIAKRQKNWRLNTCNLT